MKNKYISKNTPRRSILWLRRYKKKKTLLAGYKSVKQVKETYIYILEAGRWYNETDGGEDYYFIRSSYVV